MSERDWKLYVEDILKAINFIEDYIDIEITHLKDLSLIELLKNFLS